MPAPLSHTSTAPATAADPTDRFQRRDGYDDDVQQSSSRRYMSSRRNSLSSFPPRDKQNHYENSEVIRSASGSHLTALESQRTDRPDAETFYHNPRNRYKSMPTPPSRTASLATSANLAHQGYVPNGIAYPQDQYEHQQRQSRLPESNFSRNANHRKSALRSFRKWMKNRFKTSKSAPDGFHSDQHHQQQQQHRSSQFTSAYPQRPWEQNMSNGSPFHDAQRPTPRQPQHHSSQEQPPLPRHQPAPINAQYQPPIQNHQQREPSSRLPPVPTLIANVMPPQPQSSGNDAAHYSPDEQDSGVETPSTSEKPAALLRDMPTPCLTGIKNHGNTCYINAVLQCLSATDLLAEYLVTERFARDLEDQTHAQQKISRQFGTNGAATRSLAGFLQRLWFNRYDESVSRDFKALIGQFSADYRTASQQDAQEFLVWLLDKVHEDLNTATKRTYKQASAGKIKGSEEDLADEALVRHRRAHCSYVTNLFEAQFRSSVWCPDCHNTKLNFDPYMCVSLPVPQDTKKPLFVTMVFWNRRPRLLKLGLNADVTAKLGDVKNCLKLAAQVNPHEVVMCDLSESGFRCVFPDATEVVALGSVDKMIYAIETPPATSPVVLDDRFAPSPYESSRANPDDIVVLFCNTVGSEVQSSRRGCPFSLRIDREVSYELLCRRLLAMARPMLRKNIDVLDVPFSAFRLRVADDFAPGVYLDGGVTMPLYTQDVDHALNYGNRAYAGPQTLRLVLEWDPSTHNLYLDDVTETVLDHQSCADLVEEMKAPAATLMQCLKEYTQTETLEEWRCDSCKRKQRRAEKSLKFRSVPDVLVIHLKRFRHLPDGETVKLDPTVQFPIDSLDLSVFTYHSGTTPVPFRKANGMYQQNRPSTHQSGRSSGHNTWQGRKQRAPSGNSNGRQPEQVPPGGALYVNTEQSQNLYDLFAVVNHKGESMNSGHYTAYCRNPVDGHWRLFDDTYVQPVDAKQVVSNAAYLLFYERRGSSTRTSCRNSSESGFSDHWFYRLPARIVQKYLNPTQVNGGVSSATTPRPSRPTTPASTIDDSEVPSFNRNDPKRDPHSPHSPNRAQTPTRTNGDLRKPPAPLPRPSLLTGVQQPSHQQSATNWYTSPNNNSLISQQRKTSAHIKSCSAIETDL